jgi:hypothetical protein
MKKEKISKIINTNIFTVIRFKNKNKNVFLLYHSVPYIAILRTLFNFSSL